MPEQVQVPVQVRVREQVLLLRRRNTADWEALVPPGRRLKPGTRCSFGDGLLRCEVLDNVQEIVSAGTDIVVAGSAVFKTPDIEETTKQFISKIRSV